MKLGTTRQPKPNLKLILLLKTWIAQLETCVFVSVLLRKPASLCAFFFYFSWWYPVSLKHFLLTTPSPVPLFLSGLHSPGLRRRQYLYPRPPTLCQHVRVTQPRPLTSTCKHSTLDTDTHTHSRAEERVSVIPHTMSKVYTEVVHIIVTFTMGFSLLSIVFPAVRYLHGNITQTSCHCLPTDTLTYCWGAGYCILCSWSGLNLKSLILKTVMFVCCYLTPLNN